MDRCKLHPKAIWNVDDTGVGTVQKPQKIVALRGVKQIGCLTFTERGELVTICAAVRALGQCIPPFFVFPRVHCKEHFIRSAPPGSKGTAHRSGWMADANFVKFLHHFVEQLTDGKRGYPGVVKQDLL